MLTLSRFAMSFLLLFINPLSDYYPIAPLFLFLYTLCIASDIIDGPIARATKTSTNAGAILDSAADLTFIAVVLIKLLPALPFELWMLYLVALVLFTRFVAFGIGFAKHRTLTLLHTYSNKGAGLVMACFPIFYMLFNSIAIAFSIAFAAAFISAFEEFLITIISKKLDRNVVSIFHIAKEG
jgi:CDP-diacylglycerol--glycerol-3-phosphate 3-phosphatidyltransferase